MKAKVIQGDVFAALATLAPGSIDCVVSSPPYWALRSYLPKDHPLKPLELGSEPTPQAWVENQVKVLRLVRAALADHGTVWWNVGDTYSSHPAGNKNLRCEQPNGSGRFHLGGAAQEAVHEYGKQFGRSGSGIPEGSLCLIPQRLAIALSDDGWLVRSVIAWVKPAPMPASLAGWRWQRCRVKVKSTGHRADRKNADHDNRTAVGLTRFTGGIEDQELAAQWSDCPGCDRCRPHGGYVLRRGSWRCTASWEPILMLAKAGGYYGDGEAVKTPGVIESGVAKGFSRQDGSGRAAAVGRNGSGGNEGVGLVWETTGTANLRDVWRIGPESLADVICPACHWVGKIKMTPEQRQARSGRKCPRCGTKVLGHYAAFPSALVENCLRAGTSARGYCPSCGKPWARVVEMNSYQGQRFWSGSGRANGCMAGGGHEGRMGQWSAEINTLDWRPTCSCPPQEPRPGVVLDCFCGSGRTGIEAGRLGLDFVGIELNPQYAELARRLLYDEAPLFHVQED